MARFPKNLHNKWDRRLQAPGIAVHSGEKEQAAVYRTPGGETFSWRVQLQGRSHLDMDGSERTERRALREADEVLDILLLITREGVSP